MEPGCGLDVIDGLMDVFQDLGIERSSPPLPGRADRVARSRLVSWLASEHPEVPDPSVELAARELAKLKKEDLDVVLQLLRSLRKSGGGGK